MWVREFVQPQCWGVLLCAVACGRRGFLLWRVGRLFVSLEEAFEAWQSVTRMVSYWLTAHRWVLFGRGVGMGVIWLLTLLGMICRPLEVIAGHFETAARAWR